jgi:hypothetical protein
VCAAEDVERVDKWKGLGCVDAAGRGWNVTCAEERLKGVDSTGPGTRRTHRGFARIVLQHATFSAYAKSTARSVSMSASPQPVAALYRRFLRLARRLPQKEVGDAVTQIRKAFREGRNETDDKA